MTSVRKAAYVRRVRRLFLAMLIWSAAAPTAALAQGGFGFQGDVAVTYSFFKNFLVEVGYRYWTVDPGGGKKFTYPAEGGRLTDKLQDMKITRSGPFLGLQAR